MALAYLLCLTGSLVALAVILRRHPAPTTPPQAPAPAPALPSTAEAEVRTILTAVARLAARLGRAA
jgi:hypothetical protein